jgi:nitrate reductase NapA
MSHDPFGWNQLTRRELMRLLGVSAGLMYVAPLAGCDHLWERQPVIPVDSWHKGVCRFCGTGCGVMIGLKDNKVVDVKGDDEAHNRGRLCIKGLATRDILYTEGRALYPMIRKNGGLQRASWDEAMTLVAQRFKQAIGMHGPDSVAYYGSGQLYTQESYTANKLFKAGIGTNNVDGNPRLCMASAASGDITTFGKDEPPGCYEDMDHAECFFITGSNTLECHPILWERVQDRKRSHPGTKIVLVDPRKTFTARHADMHLSIYPGTDVSLYNAMIHVFLEQDFLDSDMVRHYLAFQEGERNRTFDDFKRHIAHYTPEAAAKTCGITPRDIREAAFLFASSKATMSLWTMGLNQQVEGTASNRLISAMHLLTGQIGRPGATPFS